MHGGEGDLCGPPDGWVCEEKGEGGVDTLHAGEGKVFIMWPPWGLDSVHGGEREVCGPPDGWVCEERGRGGWTPCMAEKGRYVAPLMGGFVRRGGDGGCGHRAWRRRGGSWPP